jgi:hypothetical protein
MARIDASLARNDAALSRNETSLDRDRDVLERNEQAFLDLRTYLQQATTALGLMAAELREGRKQRREESRAYINVLFAILDRLDNGPPPTAA